MDLIFMNINAERSLKGVNEIFPISTVDVYNSLLSAVSLMIINPVKALLCLWEYMIFYPYFPHLLSSLDEV
jgi:hypothetical protein